MPTIWFSTKMNPKTTWPKSGVGFYGREMPFRIPAVGGGLATVEEIT
jgi:hypothetical protein